MSLKPIDLQTLFVNLHNVAREQAARQAAPVHTQHVAAEEFKQKTLQDAERVHASEDTGSGPEKIHDEQNQSGEQREHDENGEENEEKAANDDPFKDPDLGNKVDISG